MNRYKNKAEFVNDSRDFIINAHLRGDDTLKDILKDTLREILRDYL